MACALLPLLGACVSRERIGRGWMGILCLIAGMSIVTAWYHLWGFDREARPFEKVMAAMPPRAKLLYIAVDRGGAWMRTAPYLHFGAYIQAEKGGVLAVTFPRFFWNIPVKMRADLALPPTPRDFEWDWSRFDDVTIRARLPIHPAAQGVFGLPVASSVSVSFVVSCGALAALSSCQTLYRGGFLKRGVGEDMERLVGHFLGESMGCWFV